MGKIMHRAKHAYVETMGPHELLTNLEEQERQALKEGDKKLLPGTRRMLGQLRASIKKDRSQLN